MAEQISRQKVSAAMRKANLRAAKWNRSGMVRGWGSWSSGVRVYQGINGVCVCWQVGQWSKENTEPRMVEIATALGAAGIPYERVGDVFKVGAKL
jgi:hypothetical protein